MKHHKSILIQLQQIWTCCVFLSSLNNTFVLIIRNNTFFIHAMNYFSVVHCTSNYFPNVYVYVLPKADYRDKGRGHDRRLKKWRCLAGGRFGFIALYL